MSERCGQFFQADTPMTFKCGREPGHDGPHGECDQDVLARARDVAAERVPRIDVAEFRALASEHRRAGIHGPVSCVELADALDAVLDAYTRAFRRPDAHSEGVQR